MVCPYAFGNENATKRSPLAVCTRIRTAVLPCCLAESIPDFTSCGVETDLPATSRMTSPLVSPFSAAAPPGSTPTIATPFWPAPSTSPAGAS